MKLHDAIIKVIEDNGVPMTTTEIANELNTRKLYLKNDGSEITSFQIHGRTKDYSNLFTRNGSMVNLVRFSSDKKSKRPPKWHRDELILALDLYFRTESGQIHARNPEIIALSEILNKLPIHARGPEQTKFRNPNGVGLKLSNFLAIDPEYSGKGMKSYGKLDKEIFNEFKNNKSDLSKISNRIKKTISNSKVVHKLSSIDEGDDEIIVKEGKVIYKLHKYIERKPSINRKKKELYLKKYGKLDCEVCGFDFYKKYGQIGKGFMECHHRIPLHQISDETETHLSDLALVCANCHRMLHRYLNSLSINELKERIKE